VSAEEVARRDLPFEYMLGALRLRDGFSLTDFGARTGLPLSAIDPPLREALSRGWLTQDGAWVAPTERGFDFLSDLQSLFLPD
jgi:coproporphyrinogen III oxidase-like Fe-S oxidoreductase